MDGREQMFEIVRRVTYYTRQAIGRSTTTDLRVVDRWTDSLPGTWCRLCRYEKVSPKSFSKAKDVCQSCAQRECRPRWVNIAHGAVLRWRSSLKLGLREFASIAGWTHTRQIFLERQHRIQPATAKRLAEIFVKTAADGYDISLIFREWPLFPLLLSIEEITKASDAMRKLDMELRDLTDLDKPGV